MVSRHRLWRRCAGSTVLALGSHGCLWIPSGAPWPESGDFSLASWNILSPRFETDNYHPYVSKEHRAWEYRKPLLVKRMLDLKVDIMCCQEAANERLSFVSELETAGYAALVPPRKDDASEGIEKPITFVRREKFEVVASDYRSRANLHALRALNSDRTLLLANVHLQGNPRATATRRSQLRSALRRLRRLGGDGDLAAPGVVLAGDFNDLAGSRLHLQLQQGLLDSHEAEAKPWCFSDALGQDDFMCTFRGAGRCDRIDFIYTNGLASNALRKTLTTEEEEKLSWSFSKGWPPWPELVPGAWFPSDHVPVAVQLSWL